MIVSKPVIVAHSTQIFFNFLAMACFASVAAFQAKWEVGPSGLSGFAIFVSIAGMLLSAFMLFVPVAYEKYDKFVQLARLLKEVRVSFILTGTGTALNLLIAFITIISAFTQAGCKDPEKDPNAEEKGDDFKDGLPGWCNTKKAGSFFFLFAFFAWTASLVLLIMEWRSGKLTPHRDPPFTRPTMQQASEDLDEEDEAGFTHIQAPVRNDGSRYNEDHSSPTTGASPNPFNDPHRYASPSHQSSIPAAGRPSMDAYGAFSDPAPTGFGNTSYGGGGAAVPGSYASDTGYGGGPGYVSPPRVSTSAAPPVLPEPDMGPRVSRTMQYADPYAAVRASIAGAQGGAAAPPTAPPSYENYGGYR
ncbi:hypothetical protein CC2G_007538 [Coprinopsis cinerea AmutBmut pab1-1]|nr:hypothetical protein CC2G_007538 [Coprinopsis cinerea AmutBmut pab1-1]